MATMYNRQNLSTIKNDVKTVAKLSRKRIQVEAKTLKLEKENSMIKS